MACTKTPVFDSFLCPCAGCRQMRKECIKLGECSWLLQIRVTVTKQRQKQLILTPSCTLSLWDTAVSLAPEWFSRETSAPTAAALTAPASPLPPTPSPAVHIPQSQGYGGGPWQLAEVGMIHFSSRICATLPSSPPSDLFFSSRNGMQLCKPCPFPSRGWDYGRTVGRSDLLLSFLFV